MIEALRDRIYSQITHRVICQTCERVFLDISFNEFMKLHNPDPNHADLWYLRVIEHLCLNPTHEVMVFNNDKPTHDLTKELTENCSQRGCSIQELYAENAKWIQEAIVEARPI